MGNDPLANVLGLPGSQLVVQAWELYTYYKLCFVE